LTGIDQAIFKNHIQYANSILDSVGEGSLLTPEESDVLTAVQQLPLKYRSVIHLFYIEGYSISEIGSILGLKVSTVGSQLARAMLRSRLKEGFDE
jgi:RNA polymerase sigma factor (sigma-70 family)